MNIFIFALIIFPTLVAGSKLLRLRRQTENGDAAASLCDKFSCNVQGTECRVKRGRAQCVCLLSCPRPRSQNSFTCGSDGVIYLNRCLLDKTACEVGHVISVVDCSTITARMETPQIVETPRRHRVKEGSSLTIRCLVTRPSQSQFYWIKKGTKEYLPSVSLPDVTISEASLSLTIKKASSKHEGLYECLALNNAGFKTVKHEVTIEENKCQRLAREQARVCMGRSHSRFWTYDPSDPRLCFRVRSRICSAVTNRFKSRKQCEKTCADPCKLRPRTGPCRRYTPRLYFDHRTQTCKIFAFGGCNGNDNNFLNYQACQRKCVDKLENPRLDCPTCPVNVGTSYCNDDFAIAGILTGMEIDDVQWPFVTIRITNVYKDTGETMNGITPSDGITRELEVEVEKKCSCPDLEGLVRNRTLGSSEAEVILTGKYIYGIPTITQGSLGVLATSTNKDRMRANVRDDLCAMLERVRNLQRTRS